MFSSHFYSSLFLTAALASCQQLLIGAIVCFLFSHTVTVCGFLKPLLLHFLGSREGRALSWPVVLPVSGVTPPSQHPAPSPQPMGPGKVAPVLPLPQLSLWSHISVPRNVKASRATREVGPLG